MNDAAEEAKVKAYIARCYLKSSARVYTVQVYVNVRDRPRHSFYKAVAMCGFAFRIYVEASDTNKQ